MRVLIALVLLASATARAETVEELTATAHNVARDGRCEALPAIGERVKTLDPDYYARVFAVDPVIAGCSSVDPRAQIGAPPAMTPPSLLAPMPREAVAPKSPGTALALSGGTTLAGIGLVALGTSQNVGAVSIVGSLLLLVGPTAGHTYAGDTFNTGLGVRMAGLGGMFVGILLSLRCIDGCQGDSVAYAGAGLAITGSLLYVGGGLYEIATAPDAAKAYNRTHGIDVTVVPTGNGLAVAGTF